ncbi:MAG: hypothetical protein HOV81_38415, partial [Kofleriaceae bacterium]|nr:hypothetical protein [Kofleriaceae bacterium]
MRVMLVWGLCALTACASSRRDNCDPALGTCADVDASSEPQDAPPVPIDMMDAPNKGFGEPCTDSQQCASSICLLVPTGGVCTMTCPTCPDGWGCFGVLGAIEPDQIAFVCVPVTTQLCSPCQQDTECAQIGMDKCLTEDSGRSYCSRDCSTVSCPSGYDCVDTQIGPSIYKECVPHSGACDCNTAMQAGATDACTITTALGTSCAGTTTCGGTAGWGACDPPSQMDAPDAAYGDENCDGIDGDITKGIFVAGGGTNSATCGLTYQTPCQTISFGIVRGVQASRPNVYVQAGTYNEVVVLQSGINVWGGYDFNWHRGPYSNPANRVVVTGGQDSGVGGDGEYMAVRAHDLIVPVMMADLVLQGPNAQGLGGASGRDGRSSYVIHAKAATVALARVQLVAGMGAPGGTGSAGQDAELVDAQTFMVGKIGGAGDEFGTVCNSSSRGAGGAAGTNSCGVSPSTRAMNGGAGGRGGTMDTSCGVIPSLDARAGDNGADAALVLGSNGVHGNGGSGVGSCGPTTSGNPGRVANGAAGTAASGGYLGGTNSMYWYARVGGSGGTGENGTGGGGGGGGGGCDDGTDAYGAGGGGGGAG